MSIALTFFLLLNQGKLRETWWLMFPFHLKLSHLSRSFYHKAWQFSFTISLL
jgi:hypothetical protein